MGWPADFGASLSPARPASARRERMASQSFGGRAPLPSLSVPSPSSARLSSEKRDDVLFWWLIHIFPSGTRTRCGSLIACSHDILNRVAFVLRRTMRARKRRSTIQDCACLKRATVRDWQAPCCCEGLPTLEDPQGGPRVPLLLPYGRHAHAPKRPERPGLQG